MSERSLISKIAVEGDKQYSSALKTINSSLKALNSQLALTTSSFANNANSEAALVATNRDLSNVIEAEKNKIETLKAALNNAQQAQQAWKTKLDESKAALNSNQSSVAALQERIAQNKTTYEQYAQRLAEAKQKMEDLRNSSQRTTREQTDLQQVINGLEKKMSSLSTEIERDTKESQMLSTIDKTLAADIKQLETNYTTATRTANNYATQLNNEQVILNQLNESEQRNKQYLEEAQKSTDKCATSIDKFGKEVKETGDELDDTSDGLDNMSNGLNALGSALSMMGIDAMIGKITNAFKECIDTASQFEYTMATVEAVSGATDDQLAQLASQAETWAGSTIFLAQDIASTYEQMGRAGYSAQQMLDSMTGTMSLATSSGESLTDCTTIVVTALNAFGESADSAGHFADVLAETSADSATNVAQLGEAFTAVGTTAGMLGFSIDDVSVALGALADNGIRGQMAGTGLATMLTRLSGANETAAKAMDRLNVSMFDESGSALELSDFLSILRSKFEGLSEAEASNLAYQLAGQRGMKSLLAIVNTSQEDWDELTQSIQDCGGAANEMSDIQLDTFQGSVQLLQSAMEGLRLEVGGQLNEALRGTVDELTEVIKKMTEWIAEHENAVRVIAGVVAGLSAFLAVITTVAAVMGAAALVAGALGAALLPVVAVAGVLGAAIGLVTADFLAANDAAEGEVKTLKEVKKAAKDAADALDSDINSHKEYKEESKATAEEIGNMVTRLDELGSKSSLTAAEQEELKTIIDSLNDAIPDLNLSFDETTGSMNMTAQQVKTLADEYRIWNDLVAAKDNQENMKNRMDDAYAAASQAFQTYQQAANAVEKYKTACEAANQPTSPAALNALQKKADDAKAAWDGTIDTLELAKSEYEAAGNEVDILTDKYNGVSVAADKVTGETKELTAAKEEEKLATEEEIAAQKKAQEEYDEANKSLRDIKDEIYSATGTTEQLREKYEELVDTYEDLDGAGNEYLSNLVAQRLEQMNLITTTQELTEAFGSNLTAMNINATALAQMLIASGTSVEEFQSLVNDNLKSLINGWKEYDLEETQSLDDINSALKANTATYDEWNAAANEAWNLAVQTGDENAMAYVKNLEEMGVEGTAALEELVAGGEEALTAAGELWGNATQQSIDAALREFAQAQGISYDEAYAMAQEGAIAMNDATGQYEEAGSSNVDAAASGAEGSDALNSAMQTVLETALETSIAGAESFNAVGTGIVTSMHSGIGAKGSSISTKTKSVINAAKSAGGSISFWQLGYNISAGIAQGVYDGGGLISTAVVSVINEALDAGQAAADSHSPSRRFEKELGVWLPAGVAVGIKKKAYLVKDAMREMIDGAVPSLVEVQSTVSDVAAALGFNDATNGAGLYGINNGSTTLNVQVYGSSGMDERKIANIVMDRIATTLKQTQGARRK